MIEEVTYPPETKEVTESAPDAINAGGSPLTKEQFQRLVTSFARKMKKNRRKRNKFHCPR